MLIIALVEPLPCRTSPLPWKKSHQHTGGTSPLTTGPCRYGAKPCTEHLRCRPEPVRNRGANIASDRGPASDRMLRSRRNAMPVACSVRSFVRGSRCKRQGTRLRERWSSWTFRHVFPLQPSRLPRGPGGPTNTPTFMAMTPSRGPWPSWRSIWPALSWAPMPSHWASIISFPNHPGTGTVTVINEVNVCNYSSPMDGLGFEMFGCSFIPREDDWSPPSLHESVEHITFSEASSG